ncbi:MAG: hypothetical protein EBQ96_08540 [Proteobacteria bacterium]|nr:hypothetical protein [Pseudomonadota bacterium]
MKTPKVLGHRLSRKEGVYENTIAGFERVIRYADGVETDAVLSKDNQVFIIHDTYFTGSRAHYELGIRLSEESKKFVAGRRIDEMTAAEIEQITLIDGHRIPRFGDLLPVIQKAGPDFTVNMEIKAPKALPLVAQQILEATAKGAVKAEQFFFSSFNHYELAAGKAAFPQFKYGMLYEPSNTRKAPMYPWLPQERGEYTPFSLAALDSDAFKTIAPDYLCLNVIDMRLEVFETIRAKAPHIKVFVWWYYPDMLPADDHSLYNSLCQLHEAGMLDMLEGIITDYPEKMVTLLKTFKGEWH